MSRKRKDDESFSDYKKNLKEENYKLKNYLKGKIIWESSIKGTFRN